MYSAKQLILSSCADAVCGSHSVAFIKYPLPVAAAQFHQRRPAYDLFVAKIASAARLITLPRWAQPVRSWRSARRFSARKLGAERCVVFVVPSQ